MGRRRSSSVNTLHSWVRRQSVKAKIFMAITTVLSIVTVLRNFVTNFNHFFVASEAVHAVGIIVLIYKLHARKSCVGISLQTQELTALILAIRISCRFVMGHDIHTILDLAALVPTAWVIYTMRFKLNATYQQHLDKTPKFYLLFPCAVMALFIHPHSYTPTWTKIKWAFCVYLESVAVLPQLHMMQRTRVIEPFTANYVFALGIARFFGAAHWMIRVYELAGSYLFLLSRGYLWLPMLLVSQVVQTFILADFCYYYVKSCVSGELLVKLPQV